MLYKKEGKCDKVTVTSTRRGTVQYVGKYVGR